MNRTDEFRQFIAAHPDVSWVDACFVDLTGNTRGKRIPLEDAAKIWESGVNIPYSIYFLNVRGGCDDPCGLGESDGDPDGTGVVMPGSLVPVPWNAPDGAQVMLRLMDAQGQPSWTDPRTVVESVLERWSSANLRPVVAFELEFYLFGLDNDEHGAPRRAPLYDGGPAETGNNVYDFAALDARSSFFSEIREACSQQGIDASAITSEFAPGQYEINLRHRSDPVAAADECVMFKRLVQGVATSNGMRASFMAKPFPEETGSGMHLHMSVLDAEGNNIFDPATNPDGDRQIREAIGGLLETMPSSLSFIAPNVNSWRRFTPDSFVPLNRSWGHNNRAVACRIPAGATDARRIEYRVPGADANPYLALAVMLAGADYGLRRHIDPGPEAGDRAGDTADPLMPVDFADALRATRGNQQIKDYFSKDFVELYTETKSLELAAFRQQMSSQEYDWYL